jgi:hypothetical protein
MTMIPVHPFDSNKNQINTCSRMVSASVLAELRLLVGTGTAFLTTAEEKSNCCCNSDQGKPAKLHGAGASLPG